MLDLNQTCTLAVKPNLLQLVEVKPAAEVSESSEPTWPVEDMCARLLATDKSETNMNICDCANQKFKQETEPWSKVKGLFSFGPYQLKAVYYFELLREREQQAGGKNKAPF